MKILIVDDSLTMRRIIMNSLKDLGYSDFIEAENGKQGLDRLQETMVDLVITDWNMPVRNGLEMVKSIRALKGAFADVPILMVTTNATSGDVVEALKAGVDNYVTKPMTKESLKEKILMVTKNAG